MKLIKSATALAALAIASGTVMNAEHLKSVNPKYIDKSIAAGDDFYAHVNKGWQEAHPLSAEYARYGVFNVLADSAEAKVKDIVLNLGATNPQKGSNAYKIWTLYSQGMDSVRRNAEGNAPIQADLRKIEAAKPEEMADCLSLKKVDSYNQFYESYTRDARRRLSSS